MAAVHQFLPVYAARSAVGNHTDEVAKTLRSMGLRGEVWAYSQDDRSEHVKDWRHYPGPVPGEPTWILYQLSTGSPMADALLQRREPKIVNYHNITPAAMFAPWEPTQEPTLASGRRQMAAMASSSVLAVADSGFNGAELEAVGYQRVVVVPVLVDLEALGSAPPDQVLERRLATLKSGGGADWLFVGRVAPNKCQHEVVKAFAVYRRCFDPRARLWLVGGSSSPRYALALARFVADLGLSSAVTLTGSVSPSALVSYYRSADVFVCLSRHEGFCVPLLEAMWHRVPVVALGSSAVPETLGSAGVLVPEGESASVVAAAVRKVLGGGGLRDQLVGSGLARVAELGLDRTRPQFAAAIAGVLAGAA